MGGCSMLQKPNIIFFFSDQQRWDTLGCYGQKLPITPNLDKLAEEGTKFEYAFTCQPVCGPARSCLQTGLYATQTGCFTNGIALPQNQKTIAQYFNENGYQTAYIGKWHLATTDAKSEEVTGERFNYCTKPVPEELRGGYKDWWMAADVLEFTSHGYDGHVFDKDNNKVEFKGYRTDCITDFALDFIRQRDGEKPFFMFLSHIEPHHQNDRGCYEGPEGSKERFRNYEVPGDLTGTEGDWRENYSDYLGCCERLDYNVGKLVDLLKQEEIYENTVLIYTSDHGCHFRTRNGEYKRSCHEGSIRIPMVACGPSFEGGKTIDEIVSLIDIPVTLLSAGGIDTPEHMMGRPLQSLVDESAVNWPREAFIQISESQVGRAIRTRKWKYSVKAPGEDGWQHSKSDVYIDEYLYDLENDYHEKNNLVADPQYSQVREQLRQRLIQRMVDAGEKAPLIQSVSE